MNRDNIMQKYRNLSRLSCTLWVNNVDLSIQEARISGTEQRCKLTLQNEFSFTYMFLLNKQSIIDGKVRLFSKNDFELPMKRTERENMDYFSRNEFFSNVDYMG